MTVGVDIHRENGNTIVVEALLNEPSGVNQLTRGETAELTVFEAEERLITLTDKTIETGEVKNLSAVIIDENATLTVNGTLNTGRIEIINGTLDNNGTVTVDGETGGMDILTYADRAGSFATQNTLDATVKFREFLPDTGDLTSLLVGVEPANDLQEEDIPGIWGLIESVEDARRPVLNAEEITVEIRVLSRWQDFADHTAVRNTLEI